MHSLFIDFKFQSQIQMQAQKRDVDCTIRGQRHILKLRLSLKLKL